LQNAGASANTRQMLTVALLRGRGLEHDFRRAVRQVPGRERPGLCAWLRRYRCHCRHEHHAARTFHELDPATGHWRRL
jgi:hypothetical protein